MRLHSVALHGPRSSLSWTLSGHNLTRGLVSVASSPRISSAKPAAVPRPGFQHPNCFGPSFVKKFFISSTMIMVIENVRRSSTHATGRSFLLVSNRSPGWDSPMRRPARPFPRSFNHTTTSSTTCPPTYPATSVLPGNVASNCGAPRQPRQQLRCSR